MRSGVMSVMRSSLAPTIATGMFSANTLGGGLDGLTGAITEEPADEELTELEKTKMLHHEMTLRKLLYNKVEDSETWQLLKHVHATMTFSK